jgi:hypothetical protein
MKTILTLLLATLCAASAFGQTIKTLGYNTTNGTIVFANTNTLNFTNPVFFSSFAQNDLSIQLWPSFEDEGCAFGIVRGTNGIVPLLNLGFQNNTVHLFVPIGFQSNTVAATTRTNLGLGLPALTNTSNVTAMRALSGSTNTNHPFSGSVSVVGTNNTNTLVFSNGILQSVQ